MSMTSLMYFLLVAASVIIYYMVPKSMRYIVLLISSMVFLGTSQSPVALLLTVGTSLFVFLISLALKKCKRGRGFLAMAGVVIPAFLMIYLKDILQSDSFMVPIGISYYSLVLIGYVMDTYWGTAESEKNPLRFLSFTTFFPVMTLGPVTSYRQHEGDVTKGWDFSFENIKTGTARILFGLLKKLVIAGRAGAYVDAVYGDSETYSGAYILFAMILFVVQLYMDFSGCVDIALGTGKLFGIALPENFDHPFLSKTYAEFWRRWHITLGEFLKGYILYPILKAPFMQSFGEHTKKAFGKKTGKKIPVWCALFVSWFVIGYWHGGRFNYIFGVGLFCAVIIVGSEILTPLFSAMKKALGIKEENRGFAAFQVIRTDLIFMIALSFFRSYDGVVAGFMRWKLLFSGLSGGLSYGLVPEAFGMDIKDFYVMLIFTAVVMITGAVTDKSKKSLYDTVGECPFALKYVLYLALIMSVLVFGQYGTGYDAAAFIYQKF